jgi:hypothetical protein
MDCHGKTTVDLCSEPECLNSVVTLESRPDLKAPHTPNHNMLKVHRILFSRDTARTERNAKDALEAARQTLSELKFKKKPMPKCIHCQKVYHYPAGTASTAQVSFRIISFLISVCSRKSFV